MFLLVFLLFFFLCTTDVAADTAAEVFFVNFSSKTLPLYWYDGSDYKDVGTLVPYEIVRMNTFVGHRFAYGEEMSEYTVDQEEQVVPIQGTEAISVLCATTKGDLHITVQPSWSPLGAGRFLELVTKTYFDGCALNRVVKNFLTQFGISSDYEMRTSFRQRTISDDTPKGIEFQPGYMAYAGSGPNSRTTEMFIVMPGASKHQLRAFGTNPWETPFAYVDPEDVENVVAKWYAYGDMPPWGEGPDPQRIYRKNGYDKYLKEEFPQLDYIRSCRTVEESEVEEEL